MAILQHQHRIAFGLLIITSLLIASVACGGSAPHPIAVVIAQGANVSMDNGQTKNLAVTVANDSKGGGVAWTLSSGPGTLSGATTSAVTYNAPASGAAATAVVTATSVSDATKTAAITIHVSPVPTITATPTLGAGTNGSAFTFTVPVSGGTTPLTWSISVGALPTGLTLSQSGVISGTPNANATLSPYTFTVRVVDAVSVAVTQDYSLTIDNPAAPVITTTAPPAGTNGTAYSAFAFTLASGGLAPFTWSETGALPTGMTLSAGGVLSGTPHQTGSFPITVSVLDGSNPQQTGSHAFTIQVDNPAPPSITTASLPSGTVGTAYSQTIQATGGLAPYSWSVSAGTVPAGLTVGNSTTNSVTLSGTPSAAATSNFTIQITDAASQSATQAYTVTTSNPPAPSITTTSLPNGALTTAYNQTIQATGGLAPFTWAVSAGTLPAGLSLGSSVTNSVSLSGTPTTVESGDTFTIQITDSLSQSGSHAYTMDIDALPIIVTISNKILTIQASAAAITLNAVVQHDTQGVNWTLTANGANCSPTCGTLGNITATSVDYTPPATVPSAPNNAPVLTATSQTDNTKTDTDSFTIASAAAACTAQGSESVLSGKYAFSLRGYNDTGFAAVVGSFTADGTGHITAGELDMNGAFGLHTQVSINPSESTYSVGSDNRGCAVIATASGTFTTRIAVGSLSSNVATKGRIIEWETGSSAFIASGQLLKQTLSSSLSGGGYVFSIAGEDYSGPVPISCVGVMTASSGALSAGEQDCNDGGVVAQETGMTGTYTSLDSSGRGTATLLSSHGTSHFTFYMASSSELLMVGTDPQSSTPGYSGEMRPQSGTFNSSSLNGVSVFYMNGFSGGGETVADIGLFTSSAGTAAINMYEDKGGTITNDSFSCSYTVAANGKVTLSGTSCTPAPSLYLTAARTGFILTNGNGVDTGGMEPQAAGPFSNTSESGTFFMGTSQVPMQSAEPGLGSVTLNSGSATGVSDNTATTYQNAGNSFSGTFSINSAGFVTLSGDSTPTMLVISGSKLVKIDPSQTTDPNPMIMIMEK